jgi:ABC-type transport system involved in cytochrome c biogenesis ATPase subunit
VIEIDTVTKRYGRTVAVDGLSFTVRPGIVTGFLGPNGAGKSTTMRMIAGLDRPTAGRVLVNRRDYRRAPVPMAELGLLLEAKAVHRASARNHLLCLSQTNGIGRRRVDEVLGQVGLADVAGKRVGGFSLGMGQRLGVAAALLGDPAVVVLDEPVNGLDPEGVGWRSAGLPTTLAVTGPAAELPAGVHLAAYRVVQEALTNSLKHAGAGARAAVRLDSTAEQLLLEVTDDGGGPVGTDDGGGPAGIDDGAGTAGAEDGGGPAGTDDAAGSGLVGIRERVLACGGEVSARPGAAGGWRVAARLRAAP